MRKRLIAETSDIVRPRVEDWLDVERTAVVEVTSEDKDHPVEYAFSPAEAAGWRAATPGVQTIFLIFEENQVARTQEFVLRWSSDAGKSFREIVRQQWTFSPPQTVRETEKYQVELSDVTVLELIILPNISGGVTRASLKSWRLA